MSYADIRRHLTVDYFDKDDAHVAVKHITRVSQTSVSGAETDTNSRIQSKALDRSTSGRLSSVKDLFSFS